MSRFTHSFHPSSSRSSASRGSTGALFALLSVATLISGCSRSEDCVAGGSCLSEGAEGGIGGEAAEAGGRPSGSGASSAGKGGQSAAGRGGAGGKGGSSGDAAAAGDASTDSGGATAGAGDAGSSGDGSGAGEGGAGPLGRECERHSECSDGFFCSGVERCEAGRCVDGPKPCEGLVNDGCDVRCVESADECVLRASDSDGDGSLSAACLAEPGDDCNDAESTVHPGAAEICDGVDNDCNGLSDLADGHALSGTTTALTDADRLDLAWSPALDGFGMALGTYDGSEYWLEYAPVTKDGALGEPVRLLSGEALNTPRIAWNGDEFGILSRESPCSEPDGEGCPGRRAVVELSAGGEPTSFLDYGVGSQYIHDFGRIGGDWAFSLVAGGSAYAGRIDRANNGMTLSPPLNAAGTTAAVPRMAFDATRVAVAWREGATLIRWSPLSPALEPSGVHEIAATAMGGMAFGVTPEGYAFAWNAEGGIEFQRSSSDGALVCGPTFVPFGDHLSTGKSIALADSPSGTLVLAVDSGRTALQLFRFGAECELLDEKTVVGRGETIGNPTIAVGEGAVALGWNATTQDNESAFYRVLGGNLCD